MHPQPETPAWIRAYPRLLGLTVLMLVGVALVVRLADVLLMAFGAVLVAVLLQGIADPLRGRLGRVGSLLAAVGIVLAVVAAAGWAFGQQLMSQVTALAELLPKAWTDVRLLLSQSAAGQVLLGRLSQVGGLDGAWLAWASRFAANTASSATATLIVMFAGLFMAFHPRTYADGALALLPRGARPRAKEVAEAANEALKRWLLGQVFSMVLVGGTTTLGLWLAGVPSPVGLGLLAGLAQFVPVIGPMAATLPGLVVALAVGPQTFALAGLVYLGASQLEANVFTPLVLRQMVELPMAVTLFAVLGMGVLLGPLGVLFATPLAVVAFVLVRKLYQEDLLGETPSAANSA